MKVSLDKDGTMQPCEPKDHGFSSIFPPIDLPVPNRGNANFLEQTFDQTFRDISDKVDRANRKIKPICWDAFQKLIEEERARRGTL